MYKEFEIMQLAPFKVKHIQQNDQRNLHNQHHCYSSGQIN